MSGAQTKESEIPSLKQLPSHLLLVAFPATHLEGIRQALSQAGVTINAVPGDAGESGQVLPRGKEGEPVVIAASEDSDHTALDAILDGQPGLHCLCVTEGPITHVARSLKSGSHLDEATAAWRHDVEAALSLIRQHRFQCLTVLHEQVVNEPTAFARLLKEKCGLIINLNLSPEKPDAEEALFRILAAQHINQETNLSDIALELEASTWPLAEPGTAAGLDSAAAVEAYRAGSRQLEELRQKIQEIGTDKVEVTDEKARLTSRIQDLERENETMLTQLHKVQLELEDYFLRSQDFENKTCQLEKERDNMIHENARVIGELENRIKAIHKSTSWRLTKPVRAVGRVFRRTFRRR